MLYTMQQTAAAPPPSAAPSFAGLLAALTTPVPKTAWNTDDLADDVATLSYEHALRTHARYKSADAGDWSFAQADDLATTKTREAPQDDSATPAQTPSLWAGPGWREEAETKTAHDFSTMLERDKKCASITIRLSKPECDQLRRRAAQAGLTVSAYLRSCTFEAETLRAQVKDVLTELRTATSAGKQCTSAAASRSWFGWLRRLMPGWNTAQREARA
jgi:hypothetical protein